jgi:hypothetical protein
LYALEFRYSGAIIIIAKERYALPAQIKRLAQVAELYYFQIERYILLKYIIVNA